MFFFWYNRKNNFHFMPHFTETDLEKLKLFFHVKESPREREIFLMNRANDYIYYLRWIPGILFVGVWNSVAMNTAHSESDIDLFIITKTKRLWTVRILTTLIISLLWVRKTKEKHKDQFCLSFFVTETALDFKSFALKNDIYLYFWILSLKPILDYNDSYDTFIEANSSWIPMDQYRDTISENKKHITYTWKISPKISFIWNFFESLLKTLFLPRTLHHYRSLGQPFWVIISEDILKFHDKDKRKVFRDEILW